MKITINISKAREIHREKIRQARIQKFTELDVAMQRELEKENPETNEIIAKKQELRDLTIDPAIDLSNTIDDLKSIWPTDLLGPSPYNL